MSHWTELRRQARAQRRALLEATGGDPAPEALIAAAATATGLRIKGKPSGHPLLAGGEGRLDLDNGALWYDRDGAPHRALFVQAHELAHYWLHRESFACSAQQIDPEAEEGGEDFGADRAEAYSPRERQEREANVFAREFLLPGDELERRFVGDGQTAQAIAEATGFPERVVLHQLSRALLTTEGDEEVTEDGPRPGLDASQRAAAHAPSGPVLVEAGPGTGKTTALIGRISFLLDQGVEPDRVLALTFSRKAAEEMRTRLARSHPEAAAALWMDTFHAFGLELLRKHGPWPDPGVVDPVDALLILEDLLPELDLYHFRNLARPAEGLKPILSAISRAKDELVDPARYRALAEAEHARALAALEATEGCKEEKAASKAVEAAERALEAAAVYETYQAHLQSHGLYDFGDLVHQAVVCLGEEAVCEAVHARFQHVLVDEAQDLNHASAELLRRVAGDGAGLWAVGDLRQAIYRFRGASTEVVRRFVDDYPGARVLPLQTNYRSQRPILDTVRAVAGGMEVPGADAFTDWIPHRAVTDGRVQVVVAGSPEAERAGLVRELQLQRKVGGVPYREQAVLGRTNGHLAEIAAVLEEAGVPTLYLGRFFEREEVRDLLALLELAVGHGHALVRVAVFPEYAVPPADVQALLREAQDHEDGVLGAVAGFRGLTAEGQAGLRRLAGHLQVLREHREPWGFFAAYLFNHSRYLAPFLSDPSARSQARRAALYQLLLFAYGQAGAPVQGDSRRAFLRRIRRMMVQSDDRQLWQVPEWAQGIDAVRLLTVHAAKGLEFRAVYVPNLVKRRFPLSWSGDRRPFPEGVVASDPKADHVEEEDCLLFVACSRARDLLVLTRAEQGYYHQRGKPIRSRPGELVERVADAVVPDTAEAVSWPGAPPVPEEVPPVDAPEYPPEFDVRELETYAQCPREYHYRYVLQLDGHGSASPYLRFHRAARAAVRWALDQRQAGEPPDEASVLAQLEKEWEEAGFSDHAFAPLYRKEAEQMARRAVARVRAQAEGRGERPTWTVDRPLGRVRVRPDHVEVASGAEGSVVRVQRWRTGRISSEEMKRPRYALLEAGASTSYAEGAVRVETVSLASDEAHVVAMDGDDGLAAYDASIEGILRGDFGPKPDSFRCPHCPYFFVCPAES